MTPPASASPDLPGFLRDVRSRVDARLRDFFDAKRREAERLSPRSLELVVALEALTMRGGKRLRPVVTAAAMRSVDANAPLDRMVDVGAALELLQTYLLAHDDFMDGDLERRGGPAVHAVFRATYRDDHLGDALGVLAGDLASAYSLELYLGAPWPDADLRRALDALLDLRKEVYFGQHLDVIADPDVARMHDLKTGSYTVRGPARIGALLADANDAQLTVPRNWANPLGEAFQLADDLLGTFATADATGKPGDDLRHGKRTSLVGLAESKLGPADRAILDAALGKTDASDDVIVAATTMLERTGIRREVEARAESRLRASELALAGAPLDPDGIALLAAIGHALAKRDR